MGWVERHAALHPHRPRRDRPGRRHRAGVRGVRPPRVPVRRPGPAHPCGGGEQGLRPRRQVAFAGRPEPVRAGGGRLGAVQHPVRGRPDPTPRRGVRGTPRPAPATRARSGRSPGSRSSWCGTSPGAGRRSRTGYASCARTTGPRTAGSRTASTQLQLAQQATLETREGKGAGPDLGRAGRRLDRPGPRRDRRAVGWSGWSPGSSTGTRRPTTPTTTRSGQLAAVVVRRVAEQRSTWTVWNVHAEAERLLRPLRFASPEDRERVTEAVVDRATGPELSIRIAEPALIAEAPELVRASDGQSVFVPHGSDRYTTSEVLLAEDRLVAAGRTGTAPTWTRSCSRPRSAIHEAAHRREPRRRPAPAGRGLRRLARPPGGRDRPRRGREDDRDARVRVRLAHRQPPAPPTLVRRGWWRWRRARRPPRCWATSSATRAENLHKFLFENARPDGPADAWFALRRGRRGAGRRGRDGRHPAAGPAPRPRHRGGRVGPAAR